MTGKLISRTHGEFTFVEEATIGRAADNSICLESSVVSTRHARIAFDAERSRYVIEDLGSLNGTQLDGVRIAGPEPLYGLHLICFGGSEDFIFQALSGEDEGELDTIEIPPVSKTQIGEDVPVLPEALREDGVESKAPPKKRRGKKAAKKPAPSDAEPDGLGTRIEKDVLPIPEVLATASAAAAGGEGPSAAEPDSSGSGPPESAWSLEIELEGAPMRFVLAEGENLVGRSTAARIHLDVADLSRRHAVVIVDRDKVFVRDEGSRNHTFVDGSQVDEKTSVTSGASIVFGRLQARLIRDGENG